MTLYMQQLCFPWSWEYDVISHLRCLQNLGHDTSANYKRGQKMPSGIAAELTCPVAFAECKAVTVINRPCLKNMMTPTESRHPAPNRREGRKPFRRCLRA